nr:MAG TPA: hypothetical protein [Caudoviricetes sp.]
MRVTSTRSVSSVRCLQRFQMISVQQTWDIALNAVIILVAKTMPVLLLNCIKDVIYE